MTRWKWTELIDSLRARGRGSRESGAFLLGRTADPSHVTSLILYDDLDPRCLDTGIVRFDGRHYGPLWKKCADNGLEVVADVHTHPGGVFQSYADQRHPMIARAGHIAMIVPTFAMGRVTPGDVGIYRYLGSYQWSEVPESQRPAFFTLSLW